jgi:hypothetical protein
MNDAWPSKLHTAFLAGVLATLLVLLLMGMVRNEGPGQHPPSLPVAVLDAGGKDMVALSGGGRYQLATWAAGGAYGAFVLDTATGITKAVYSSSRGPGGKSVNNLGKPFARMP